MRTEKRTGILGGTFNPVHNGHIDIGLRVMSHFNLDSVRYILSANPPHKDSDLLAPTDLRWKMLKEALSPYPGLVPDDTEVKRDEYSWTIDTIRELYRHHPGETFFFLSGSEGFLKIGTWKEYRTLLKMIRFIVVMRTEDQENKVSALLSRENIRPLHHGEQETGSHSVYYYSYQSGYLNLSSTRIRNNLQSGGEITGMVNGEVEKIIEENGLYGTNQS